MRVELDASGRQVVGMSDFLSGTAPLALTFDASGALSVGDFTGVIYKVDRLD